MISTKENPLCLIHLDDVSAFKIEITAADISALTNYHTFFVVATAGCKVYWGDGASSTLATGTNTCTHTYAGAGKYLVQINGAHTKLYHGTGSTAAKVIEAVKLYSGLTSCDSMFRGCSNAKFVMHWGFRIPLNATTCFEMFRGCNGSLFTLPAGFTIPNSVTDCSYMFKECHGSAFTLPAGFTIPNSVTTCLHMFFNCYGAAFTLPAGFAIGNGVTTCRGMFFSCAGNAFNLPSDFAIGSSVTSCYGMFDSCFGTGFAIPAGFVIPANVVECYQMFRNCPSLASDISNIFPTWTAGSAVSVYQMFYSSVNVTGTLPSAKLWGRDDITWIPTQAFTSATHLTNYPAIPAAWK